MLLFIIHYSPGVPCHLELTYSHMKYLILNGSFQAKTKSDNVHQSRKTALTAWAFINLYSFFKCLNKDFVNNSYVTEKDIRIKYSQWILKFP